jgi:hypothetical protein
MDIIEKVLPFLVHFPRWLQFFFFAVFLQVLALVFLKCHLRISRDRFR